MPALQVSWAASAAGRLQAASVFFEGRQDGCVRRCADVEMLPVVLGHSYGRKAAARLLGVRPVVLMVETIPKRPPPIWRQTQIFATSQ